VSDVLNATAGESFGSRLSSTFATLGHLCVGIDPHPFLLAEWSLSDDAASLREFGLRVVDAVAGTAGMIKPQVAFFERHGSAGYAALEAVFAAARDAGILVIADAKRGDIGTTVEAYGQSWLTPGSPLEADAMTISAFQGVGSITAPHELALATGKGLFVLAATSNLESIDSQQAVIGGGEHSGRTVAGSIVGSVHQWNSDEATNNGSVRLGSTGVVLGATLTLADYGIDLAELAATPILAPGFGSQGAKLEQLGELYGAASGNVIVSASRSILSAGPGSVASAVAQQVAEVAEAFSS